MIRRTPDAYLGLDHASEDAWRAWFEEMLAERAEVLAQMQFDPRIYEDPRSSWSDGSFRQYFLFMFDASFFDPVARRFRTAEFVEELFAKFGRIDEILLWHAYPRLGFDSRTQFDFYRQMPGGLDGLRRDVSDVLHARGIRVFVDYNPWDAGSYEELAEIVSRLDADGVMLDTMTDVPAALAAAVDRRKPGVVLAPELRMKDADLRYARESWAQWCDYGNGEPAIDRHRWLVPRHRRFVIARWDRSRKKDIVQAFFAGNGLVLWENVFGSLNPYSREDRRLIAETGSILGSYQDLFVHGDWEPLIPTGVSGLDANRFVDRATGRAIVTFRNRTTSPLTYRVTESAPSAFAIRAVWGERRPLAAGDLVTIPSEETQAIVIDRPEAMDRVLARFDEVSARADRELPEDAAPRPRPRLVSPKPGSAPAIAASRAPSDWVSIAGGAFDMQIRHARRECGCYPDGAADDVMWGWYYEDEISHRMTVALEPFSISRTAVTNAEYLAFVHASGYRPRDPTRFLAHVPRLSDGSLPSSLAPHEGALPVTHVSLEDARAFAAFYGERLPTEAEWQWVAEGAGPGRRFPWGDDPRVFPAFLRAADDAEGATQEGVCGLSGNAWELTESERTDGHTRFVMLRGGSYLPPAKSEWIVARGVRPNDSHAKYILLEDGLDRSEAISFRTVRDR